MPAPLESWTAPEIDPVGSCPKAADTEQTIITPASRQTTTLGNGWLSAQGMGTCLSGQ